MEENCALAQTVPIFIQESETSQKSDIMAVESSKEKIKIILRHRAKKQKTVLSSKGGTVFHSETGGKMLEKLLPDKSAGRILFVVCGGVTV